MEQRVVDEIVRFVSESSANRLPDKSSPYFDTPLTGFASATDPQFSSYKEIIGDFHLTPSELFAGAFGDKLLSGTVICWILPITESVRKSNRCE
ncbi:MAG TPA: epoxyqueuosine reductase, partial [Geobacteraceae bacterium]|nr:epoxyqueuosine reductase [Geobacteraceae bacterium]